MSSLMINVHGTPNSLSQLTFRILPDDIREWGDDPYIRAAIALLQNTENTPTSIFATTSGAHSADFDQLLLDGAQPIGRATLVYVLRNHFNVYNNIAARLATMRGYSRMTSDTESLLAQRTSAIIPMLQDALAILERRISDMVITMGSTGPVMARLANFIISGRERDGYVATMGDLELAEMEPLLSTMAEDDAELLAYLNHSGSVDEALVTESTSLLQPSRQVGNLESESVPLLQPFRQVGNLESESVPLLQPFRQVGNLESESVPLLQPFRQVGNLESESVPLLQSRMASRMQRFLQRFKLSARGRAVETVIDEDLLRQMIGNRPVPSHIARYLTEEELESLANSLNLEISSLESMRTDVAERLSNSRINYATTDRSFINYERGNFQRRAYSHLFDTDIEQLTLSEINANLEVLSEQERNILDELGSRYTGLEVDEATSFLGTESVVQERSANTNFMRRIYNYMDDQMRSLYNLSHDARYSMLEERSLSFEHSRLPTVGTSRVAFRDVARSIGHMFNYFTAMSRRMFTNAFSYIFRTVGIVWTGALKAIVNAKNLASTIRIAARFGERSAVRIAERTAARIILRETAYAYVTAASGGLFAILTAPMTILAGIQIAAAFAISPYDKKFHEGGRTDGFIGLAGNFIKSVDDLFGPIDKPLIGLFDVLRGHP
jgi:hypothetical protein